VAAGGPSLEVTLTGTGFVSQSFVLVPDWGPRPTTFVSPTQLRVRLSDTMVSTGRTLPLLVVNPGGVASQAAIFEVRAPAPVITSLGSTQTAVGQPRFGLRVNGTGFVTGSTVHVNGTAVTTTFVNPGALDATLGEPQLRAMGTLAITVVNQGPGGGTSPPAQFQVVAATGPVITVLPSAGASAGRGGFTLHVHGTGFVDDAVVRWNGEDRPTQRLGGTRLTAALSDADVAAPGTAQVSVRAGGVTSAAVPFTVRAVGAATHTLRTVAMKGRDLVHDPGTGRLYVTVAGSAAAHANTVAEIDPSTGAVVRAAAVGSEPTRIARSHDGQFLYVGLDGAGAVRRVALGTLTPEAQWSLGSGVIAADLEVLPGQPRSVAVVRDVPNSSGALNTTLYDDGVARSRAVYSGEQVETAGSESMLYGYDDSDTAFQFFTMSVEPAGLRTLSISLGQLFEGFHTELVGTPGRLYGTDGSIVDAERLVRVGSLYAHNGIDTDVVAMAVDPALGRAFLLTASGIRVYDLNTFALLGTVPVAAHFPHAGAIISRLVRWGTDGLAFLDMNQLQLVQSPLFGP
jgi:hypothetical protein